MITIFHEDRKHTIRQLPYEVILDNIRSAYNVGAILRNCDAFGCSHAHLTGITPRPEHEKVKKTAKQTDEFVPYSLWVNGEELQKQLTGYRIYALETTDNSVSLNKVEIRFPCVFIFGHEVAGVSEFWLEHAHQIIEIPMLGRKNSINVATASGITLFFAYQQYLKKETH